MAQINEQSCCFVFRRKSLATFCTQAEFRKNIPETYISDAKTKTRWNVLRKKAHDLEGRTLIVVEIGVFKGSLCATQPCHETSHPFQMNFAVWKRRTATVAGPNTFWRNCHSSNCLVAWLHQDLPCQYLDSPTDGHCFSTPPPWNWGVDPYIGKDGTFPGDFSETLDPDMALAQVGKPNSWMVYNGKFIYKPSSYRESPSYTIFHYSYPIGGTPHFRKAPDGSSTLDPGTKALRGLSWPSAIASDHFRRSCKDHVSLALTAAFGACPILWSLSNGHHCHLRDILTWKEYSRWQLGRAFVGNYGGFEGSPAFLRFLDAVQNLLTFGDMWEHLWSLSRLSPLPSEENL